MPRRQDQTKRPTLAEKRESIDRNILRLAAPAIVNNITVPLLGLCDTAIAGHLGRASYIGAMAVGAMMLNVVYWLCGFLRMGTSGLAAQACGAGDAAMSRDVLRKALTIACAVGACALSLQVPLERLLLRVIAPDPEVTALAAEYFRILIWAAPAQLCIMAVSGWFIGMQNTVVPMAVAIGVNIVNIALSLTLVFGFGLGFAGIAAGTLCANWVGAVAALLLARRRMRDARRHGERGAGGGAGRVRWGRFFSVSGDLFVRSACIMGVTLAMTSAGARLGETTLAANAVMMQFFLFFSYFMDGFAFAAEALVGKSTGAGDVALVRRDVAALMKWGAVMAVAFLLIYAGGAEAITGLLTDNGAVRWAVGEMRWWLVALPPVTVAAFIFDGVFIGMSRTRALLVTTLVAAAAFFAIMLGAGRGETPPNGVLWLAFETYLLLRGLLLGLRYARLQGKTHFDL